MNDEDSRLEEKEPFDKLNAAVAARVKQLEMRRQRLEKFRKDEENRQNKLGARMKKVTVDVRLAADAKRVLVRDEVSQELRGLDYELSEIEAVRTALSRDAGLPDPDAREVKKLLCSEHLKEDILLYQQRIAMASACWTSCEKCVTSCIACIGACQHCIGTCVECVSISRL